MKKLILIGLVGFGLFFSVITIRGAQTAALYGQFLNTDFIIELLNEIPTREEVQNLGLSLIDSGDYEEIRRVAINNRRREDGVIVSRTQGFVHGPYGMQWVDLETRTVTPDSELDLLPRVRPTGNLRTYNVSNRVERDYLRRIYFSFGAYEQDPVDRLNLITLYGVRYFEGVDFEQFLVGPPGQLREAMYFMNEVYSLGASFGHSHVGGPGIVFVRENVEFTLSRLRNTARVTATLIE